LHGYYFSNNAPQNAIVCGKNKKYVQLTAFEKQKSTNKPPKTQRNSIRFPKQNENVGTAKKV